MMITGKTEDQVLLKRIQNDDAQAFDQLFMAYYPGLMRYCKMLLPYPSDEAEEALLDVFFKVWQQRKQLNIHSSLSSFLYTAVKNRVHDYYRKKKLKVYDLEGVAENEADAHYLLPDQQLVYKELQENIEQLISSLPERSQLIFRMNREDDLTYEEIASLLNISINSVKTQMYRAIKFLKQAYHHSSGTSSQC